MTDVVLGTMTVQEAHAITAAVRAAKNVGLLDALDQQPRSSRSVAESCDLDRRATEVLLRVLANLGLVEEHDGRYLAGHPLRDRTVDVWNGLEATLRHGSPVIACDTPTGAARVYPRAVTESAVMFADAAVEVAKILAAPGLDVIDLGAGAAPWSLAMLREARIQVTAVDYPQVLTTTRRVTAEAGVADAFRYVGGDLFTVELPTASFDLAIIANVCHLFGEDANRRLVRRAHDVLRPGGTLALVDVVPGPNGDNPDPRTTAAYDLSLLLRTSEGRVHPFSSYAAWLNETGFTELRRISLPGRLPPTLILAQKRGLQGTTR